MIYYIESIAIIVFEVFCCKIFYGAFGTKRQGNKTWINMIQFLLFCILCYLTAVLLANHFLIRQIVNIAVISIVMFWHMNMSYRKSLAFAILYEGLMLMVDYIMTYVVTGMLLSGLPDMSASHDLQRHLVVLIGKVILYLCILILRKQLGKKNTEMLVETEWLRLLIFPIFTILVISAIVSSFEYAESTRQEAVLFIIAIGLAGMNIAEFYLINDIVERETQAHENRIFQMEAKCQADMYRSISENFDKQKRKTHEYKNQIICIESLLAKGQYEELKKYVEGIYGELNEELDIINMNKVIINAILNTKYQEMSGKQIVFVFRVNDLSELGMKDEDVVIILSNLLNNAIEACDKCNVKKIIRLKFVKEDDRIIIAVKNTLNHAIRYENGEIVSTKLLETDEHGVGIKNVVRVVDKYGGSYVIQELNKEFLFSIIIPYKIRHQESL